MDQGRGQASNWSSSESVAHQTVRVLVMTGLDESRREPLPFPFWNPSSLVRSACAASKQAEEDAFLMYGNSSESLHVWLASRRVWEKSFVCADHLYTLVLTSWWPKKSLAWQPDVFTCFFAAVIRLYFLLNEAYVMNKTLHSTHHLRELNFSFSARFESGGWNLVAER